MTVPAQRPGPAPATRAVAAPQELVRIRVWDLPVRVIHWLLVLALVVLSVTGFLIGTPLLHPAATTDWVTWVKTIHEFTAYIFIALILARVMWLFQSPNRWSRWTEWIPVSRDRRKQIIPSLRFYSFLDREPPPVVGHNPLAGMTYTLLYTMFGVEILTGVVLWGVQGERWAATLTGWVLTLAPVPVIRFIHHLIMWLIWGFMVHHVYSALIVDRLEGSGLLSSIFSGFKFLPRDHLPKDRR
ncbi:MAG TPA: Ni/Fe-hydrogenase, b-type cytochrome subunit [Streptosporangiaceae bacterium]